MNTKFVVFGCLAYEMQEAHDKWETFIQAHDYESDSNSRDLWEAYEAAREKFAEYFYANREEIIK